MYGDQCSIQWTLAATFRVSSSDRNIAALKALKQLCHAISSMAALKSTHIKPLQKLRISSIRAYSTRHSKRTPEAISPELKRLIDEFSQQSPRPLTLSTLLSFSQPLTPESLLQSASYVLEDIPRRLVRRVRALEKLPFIVGTNPYVSGVLAAVGKTSGRCSSACAGRRFSAGRFCGRRARTHKFTEHT